VRRLSSGAPDDRPVEAACCGSLLLQAPKQIGTAASQQSAVRDLRRRPRIGCVKAICAPPRRRLGGMNLVALTRHLHNNLSRAEGRLATHDFNRSILQEVRHRPWPMPERRWLMTQTWHNLLFAHWPVDVRVLAPRVPPDFPLDLYDGQAWLGIVPFTMSNVAPRGVPALPWISAFPELNVRTYVRVGDRPGVYFFSLDAGNALAAAAARYFLNLPYHSASMQVEVVGNRVTYHSRRSGTGRAELSGTYQPFGSVFQAAPGSLEYFLSERYCLYSVDRKGRPYRIDIHHPPWPLQLAQAEFGRNSMAEASGIVLPRTEPLLHFSKRQDMVAWGPASAAPA
jgi:uncharacterized protein YqjF (DUF2071 family)